MENYALFPVFWYGILHAFGPDHLSAIADFSIGKSKKKTMTITAMFAIGHGVALFVFAKVLDSYNISEDILSYGDTISASVIILMGIYLLFMVYSDRVQIKKHTHKGKEHIHVWFGKEHEHDSRDISSAFTIGILMGIGGVRGMLVTLGMLKSGTIDLLMVVAFVVGVMLVFLGFGTFILYINKNLLNSKKSLKRVFTTAGIISVVVGTNMILG
ncbi:MAG: hypothetical protein JJW00_07100 [Sulfurimonas sp.]|nr:hypothetical protein [Sulfurimonas sp.]